MMVSTGFVDVRSDSIFLVSQAPENQHRVSLKLVRVADKMKVYLQHEHLEPDSVPCTYDAAFFGKLPMLIPSKHSIAAFVKSYLQKVDDNLGIFKSAQPAEETKENEITEAKKPVEATKNTKRFDELAQLPFAVVRIAVFMDSKSLLAFLTSSRKMLNTSHRSNSFWYMLYLKRFGNTGFKENEIQWKGFFLKKASREAKMLEDSKYLKIASNSK